MCRILLIFMLMSTVTALDCISGTPDDNGILNKTIVNCSDHQGCSYVRNFAGTVSLEVYACQTFNYTKDSECKKAEHHKLTSYICHCTSALCNDKNEIKQKMDKFIEENPAKPKTYDFDSTGNVIADSNTTLKCYAGISDGDDNMAKSIVRCGQYGTYASHLGCSYIRNYAANGNVENTVYACQTFKSEDSECKKAEHHKLTSYICHCTSALCNDQDEIKQNMVKFIEENPAQPKTYDFNTMKDVTAEPSNYEPTIMESPNNEEYKKDDLTLRIAIVDADLSTTSNVNNYPRKAALLLVVLFILLPII